MDGVCEESIENIWFETDNERDEYIKQRMYLTMQKKYLNILKIKMYLRIYKKLFKRYNILYSNKT